ncbi:MAG TPA: HIRAN domain-containing protein [Allosphingosinicella sp.]|jgi:hypothetical protein
MQQISRIVEPNKLKLVWQSVNGSDRTKYVVGELVRASNCVALYYSYNTADFLAAQKAGFQGHPAFDFRQPVHHHNVLEIFIKRVPPRNRLDFHQFLSKHRLAHFPSISDFALLGYSGARLPGDGFYLEIDFSLERPPLEFLMEVSGFRYYQGMHVQMETLQGLPVQLLPEPHNPMDPNAVQLYAGAVKLGYVPRPQAASIRAWMPYHAISASIERIEGAPLRPQVYLFIRIASSAALQALLTSS